MTIATFLTAIAFAPALIGGAIGLFAAIGLLRLPDHYLRLHCVAAVAVAAAPLSVFALALAAFAQGDPPLAGRLLLLLAALLVFAPIMTHLAGASVYAAGIEPSLTPGADPRRRDAES